MTPAHDDVGATAPKARHMCTPAKPVLVGFVQSSLTEVGDNAVAVKPVTFAGATAPAGVTPSAKVPIASVNETPAIRSRLRIDTLAPSGRGLDVRPRGSTLACGSRGWVASGQ